MQGAGKGAVGGGQGRHLAERLGRIHAGAAFQGGIQQDTGGDAGLDPDVGGLIAFLDPGRAGRAGASVVQPP